jgi:hypothetical protein
MAYTYTDIVVSPSQLLEPFAGHGRVIVAGLPWNENYRSVLEGADPPAVAGDILDYALTTTPGEFAVAMESDGTFALGNEDDYTTQTFEYALWRRSAAAWYGPETVSVVGDDPPLPDPALFKFSVTLDVTFHVAGASPAANPLKNFSVSVRPVTPD